jgi:hypothetical protein
MGGAGAKIQIDAQLQSEWKKTLISYETFFRTHLPFELVYTSAPVQNEAANYDEQTVTFEYTAGLRQRKLPVMQKVQDDLIRELKKTDYKKNKWGFDNWPEISAKSSKQNQMPTDFFNTYKTISVKAGLFNNEDVLLAEDNFELYTQLVLNSGQKIGADSTQERTRKITLQITDITEDMYIQIISIDGIDAEKSNADSYLQNMNVERMPKKIASTISKNKNSIPELPEEREIRLLEQAKDDEKKAAKLAKQYTAESRWETLPLEKRFGLYAGPLYNPLASGIDALSIRTGLSFGYRNFSLDFWGIFPLDPSLKVKDDKMIVGIGGGAGYSYVWKYVLLGCEAGLTYFMDTDNNVYVLVPSLDAFADLVPFNKGIALRLGYRAEFGKPEGSILSKAYFNQNRTYDFGFLQVAGQPSAALVLWF